MPYYFFPATRAAGKQITELFDFVWPTAASLWNLRWQVAGFLKEVPQSSPKELNDRFVFGSKIHGANLKRACVETSWLSQQHLLAGIILTNAFSVYEHWSDEILSSVGMGTESGKVLQFDDEPSGRPGLPSTVHTICTVESQILKPAYYSIFRNNPKYSWSIMGNLLLCYRYFKELRNCQIHNGGIANEKAEAAYRNFAPVATKASLGMKGELIHEPLVKGRETLLHLRGVVGFCDILLRMMITVDAELTRSVQADAVLDAAFRNAKIRFTFSSNPQRRHMQTIKCCKAIGLPKPANASAIQRFLIDKRFVSI
jgi:hypothetical protein